MSGVAYTDGSKHHKEIHFSLQYIERTARRAHDEILGVLTHEAVHCFQYDAEETCPGGFIEGVAGWYYLTSRILSLPPQTMPDSAPISHLRIGNAAAETPGTPDTRQRGTFLPGLRIGMAMAP